MKDHEILNHFTVGIDFNDVFEDNTGMEEHIVSTWHEDVYLPAGTNTGKIIAVMLKNDYLCYPEYPLEKSCILVEFTGHDLYGNDAKIAIEYDVEKLKQLI